MDRSVQYLQATSLALSEALVRKDWAAIVGLDQQCREAVEAVMVEPQNVENLRDRMQELLELYTQLIIACQSERGRLALELKQLNQSQQGAKVYQLFG